MEARINEEETKVNNEGKEKYELGRGENVYRVNVGLGSGFWASRRRVQTLEKKKENHSKIK